jgi:hypothetical protein
MGLGFCLGAFPPQATNSDKTVTTISSLSINFSGISRTF